MNPWAYFLSILSIGFFFFVVMALSMWPTVIDRRRRLKRIRTIRLNIEKIVGDSLEEEADEEVYP